MLGGAPRAALRFLIRRLSIAFLNAAAGPHPRERCAALDFARAGGSRPQPAWGTIQSCLLRSPNDPNCEPRAASREPRAKYHSPMLPRFTRDTLKFLRALKRNNDREWFRSRKDEYERHVRAPMIAVIEQLAKDFQRFAPELVASPKASLYRIYRDTRFSEDKTPLKTNAAAVFPWKGLARHEGAGLYFEIAPGWVWVGGGMYAPQSPQLVKVREHIVDTWPEIRKITKSKAFVSRVGDAALAIA